MSVLSFETVLVLFGCCKNLRRDAVRSATSEGSGVGNLVSGELDAYTWGRNRVFLSSLEDPEPPGEDADDVAEEEEAVVADDEASRS